MSDEWLTPKEVAQLYGVAPKTIQRWSDQGKLTPVVGPSGRRKFRASEVHPHGADRERVAQSASDRASCNPGLKVADGIVRLLEKRWEDALGTDQILADPEAFANLEAAIARMTAKTERIKRKYHL